jgi:hypothetical protein
LIGPVAIIQPYAWRGIIIDILGVLLVVVGVEIDPVQAGCPMPRARRVTR